MSRIVTTMLLITLTATGCRTATPPSPSELVHEAERILFLGDSITYAGHYVSIFDAWLTAVDPTPPIVINAGLPSETVSGLSEDGHAGGRFPRPDLAERLEWVLRVTRPDLVFACYGMNCGIQQPFDGVRFSEYQRGIRNLETVVASVGAELVLITPPIYDDQRSKQHFSYNAVLERYSRWLMTRPDRGRVVDFHGPMASEVSRRRQSDPEFTYQPDAVHPDRAGHEFLARQLLDWAVADRALEDLGISSSTIERVHERMVLRRDAYLSAAGHSRPGLRRGVPIDEAERRAAQLTHEIEAAIEAERTPPSRRKHSARPEA